MTKHVMVLKVKENKNSKFYEKDRAGLFDRVGMEKLADLTAACVRVGYEIKVEMEIIK